MRWTLGAHRKSTRKEGAHKGVKKSMSVSQAKTFWAREGRDPGCCLWVRGANEVLGWNGDLEAEQEDYRALPEEWMGVWRPMCVRERVHLCWELHCGKRELGQNQVALKGKILPFNQYFGLLNDTKKTVMPLYQWASVSYQQYCCSLYECPQSHPSLSPPAQPLSQLEAWHCWA